MFRVLFWNQQLLTLIHDEHRENLYINKISLFKYLIYMSKYFNSH